MKAIPRDPRRAPGVRMPSCYRLSMAAPDLQKLLELDLETRLALVQQLWNSIVEDANSGSELPLSTDERDLLDERLREDDEDPGAAIPWAEAKAQLYRDQ